MKSKKPGFILIFCLMMIMFASFMAIYLADRGATFLPYALMAMESKQAQLLAQSGIQLGLSQLDAPKVAKKEVKEGEQKKNPSPQDKAVDQLTIILPLLNRWQTIDLDEDRDGVEGTIKWCISCENGKIDLNAWYDFEKHQFVQPNEAEPLFKELFEKIQQLTGAKEPFPAFTRFMKEREFKLNDATELITIPSFVVFKNALFFEPPREGVEKQSLCLTDIFTVWTGSRTINPWLLSDSLQMILGFSPVGAKELADRKKMVAEWLKPFKLKVQWQTEWDKIIKPLYKREFASIPKGLQSLLGGTYEAQVFSILATATVGRVTERLLAIVELKNDQEPIIKKVYKL
jgi:hypothetical protein